MRILPESVRKHLRSAIRRSNEPEKVAAKGMAELEKTTDLKQRVALGDEYISTLSESKNQTARALAAVVERADIKSFRGLDSLYQATLSTVAEGLPGSLGVTLSQIGLATQNDEAAVRFHQATMEHLGPEARENYEIVANTSNLRTTEKAFFARQSFQAMGEGWHPTTTEGLIQVGKLALDQLPERNLNAVGRAVLTEIEHKATPETSNFASVAARAINWPGEASRVLPKTLTLLSEPIADSEEATYQLAQEVLPQTGTDFEGLKAVGTAEVLALSLMDSDPSRTGIMKELKERHPHPTERLTTFFEAVRPKRV